MKERIHTIRISNLSDEQKKQEIKLFKKFIQNIKNDLISNSVEIKSDPIYIEVINNYRRMLIPQKVFTKDDNIMNDIQKNPLDYLRCMINLNKSYEELSMIRTAEGRGEIRMFHASPLRTDIIPKYITLDTNTLIQLFKYSETKSFLHDHITLYADYIWKCIFNTDKKIFKRKGYKFHHMIQTDGVSVSILFTKNKCYYNNYTNKKNQYIDTIPFDHEDQLMKIVGIDVGKRNLLYCVDEEENKMRYTQSQRRSEAKVKRYSEIIDKFRKETIVFDNKSIQILETELSRFNSKTCSYDGFYNYLIEKNRLNSLVMEYYQQYVFRKLKWNGLVNRQRSEDQMISRFKEKFGNPWEVIIGIGD
jgi:hypothetical protein